MTDYQVAIEQFRIAFAKRYAAGEPIEPWFSTHITELAEMFRIHPADVIRDLKPHTIQ